MIWALLLLLLLTLSNVKAQGYDYDNSMVEDIFGGGQQVQEQVQEPFPYSAPPQPETRCDELRPCVECSAFHQYWHHFSSALECYNTCKDWAFHAGEAAGGLTGCPPSQAPVCGLDGNTYGSRCQAEAEHGMGVACENACPCHGAPSPPANVCSFKGNLDGDTICKAYTFVITGTNVYVYRPPCLADDLEVNVGVWNGETETVGYETFPNGWGILQFKEDDHLNREKFDGTMGHGVMEGHGNLFWKDGSKYSGQFVNNSKQGEGTLFYENGDIFSGHWSGEKKEGEGRYMFKQGGEYKGGFHAGMQEGQGKFDRGVEGEPWQYFQGQYHVGHRKTGEYKLTSGDLYDGEFDPVIDTYGGHGKYVWACGRTYEGNFLNGLPHGSGQLHYPEGWTYTGQFENGKFHGEGKFTWDSDTFFEGTFSHGSMTGAGRYQLGPDGGLYEHNRFFPNKDDFSVSYEALFDGVTMKYKLPVTKGGDAKGKKG